MKKGGFFNKRLKKQVRLFLKQSGKKEEKRKLVNKTAEWRMSRSKKLFFFFFFSLVAIVTVS